MFILVSVQSLLIWLPCFIGVSIFLWAVLTAPWKSLFYTPIRLHLFFACALLLGLFWSFLTVNINQLFTVHPLIMTTIVFMFGLRLSLLLGALALTMTHWLSLPLWELIGFHYLVNVVSPALVTIAILHFIDHLRIQNVFIYILGGGFFGSMLAVFSTGLLAEATLWLSASSLRFPVWDHFYLFAMLTFPEGFINGAIITTLTILRPDLVKTYNDSFYLDGKD
ncbi:MAG: hypothetical protein ACRBBR_02870 [Cellvibrionaceae bacterium]